jgi:hypothetical protein
MQVDFNFSPVGVTVLGNAVDQSAVVLLGRVEVSMYERPTLLITPQVHRLGIVGTPVVYPALLFRERRTQSRAFGQNSRLEMIGKYND